MISILHKGIQPSLTVKSSEITGDPSVDVNNVYLRSLVAGSVYTLDANGFVALNDGAVATSHPFGYLVTDAVGYFMENTPTIASGKIAGTIGDCVVITDRIVLTETFIPGDILYVGTGANVGRVTKTVSASKFIIGVAGSAASSAAPNLIIYPA